MDKDKVLKEIHNDIDSFDVDDIKTKGITIRVGSNILKFKLSEEEDLSSIENEIREEYKKRIREKLNIIKEKVSEKMIEMSNFVNQLKLEYESKEEKLKRKLRNVVIMPDVKFKHACSGLSVVKGDMENEIIWLVNGIYWPKFVNEDPIDPKFSKKMISNIVFLIKTRNNKVLELSTRKPIGMEMFEHYHQNNPDCWGDWSPSEEKFNGPDDAIRIARKAEALLEYINKHSIAKSSPRGLPRLSTVKNHLISIEKAKKQSIGSLNQQIRRAGITQTGIGSMTDDGDIWST